MIAIERSHAIINGVETTIGTNDGYREAREKPVRRVSNREHANDGYGYRAPIGCFDPNDFDLFDMIEMFGNAPFSEYQNRNQTLHPADLGQFEHLPGLQVAG